MLNPNALLSGAITGSPTPSSSSSRTCSQMHCYQVLSPVSQHQMWSWTGELLAARCVLCTFNFNFWCSSSGVSGERSAHKAWSWSSNLFLFAFHYKQIITRGSKFPNCLRRFRFDSTSPMRLQILTRQISLSSVNKNLIKITLKKCRFYILVFTVKIELNRTIRLGDVKETNRTQAGNAVQELDKVLIGWFSTNLSWLWFILKWFICLFLPSSCTASLVSGRLLLRSLGTIGFRDVTETNHGVHPCDVTEIDLGVDDRAHGERKWPSN